MVNLWRFVKHLAFDIVLWYAMVMMAFGDNPLKTYLSNGLTFYFAFIFVLSILILLVGRQSAEHSVNSGKYIKRPKYHEWYAVTSTVCEIVFAAVMGWYWFAFVMLVSAFATAYLRHWCDKISESPVTAD